MHCPQNPRLARILSGSASVFLLAAFLFDGFGQGLSLNLFVAQGRSLLKCSNRSAQSLAGQLGRRGLLRLWLGFYFRLRLRLRFWIRRW